MKKGMAYLLIIASLFWGAAAVFAGEKANPIKVACVGDSITYGFGIENRETQSYPAQLGRTLGARFSVHNFGRNGRTALKRGHAPYWKTPEYKAALALQADIVVIKLGTNDLRSMNWDKHSAEYVPDYIDLIRSFQALESKPTIWICYPVPTYPGHDKIKFNNDTIKHDLVPKIDEVAKQTGVNIIDLNTTLNDQEEMFPDKVHPNANGARLIATEVAKTIRHKFPVQTK
ncbi:GDSL-type esterase/lipase family protein [Rubritalea spongiae]|uniref:GDSL-type esterase/lipase family protein n=1 Tax=Rubritalea spongiae TaxID=430797 RepID=A0ABW5E193_9BACT